MSNIMSTVRSITPDALKKRRFTTRAWIAAMLAGANANAPNRVETSSRSRAGPWFVLNAFESATVVAIPADQPGAAERPLDTLSQSVRAMRLNCLGCLA